MSSNSNRIEAATRQHVGATLTSAQITELVRLSDPSWKGGVYPSDCAYVRTDEGLVPRGKTAYRDGVLEYVSENNFKVLPTEQIVRRKTPKPVAATKTAAAAAPAEVKKPEAGKKKSGKATRTISPQKRSGNASIVNSHN